MTEASCFALEDGLVYLRGFGNEHSSEALAGALPIGRNNPKDVPHQLYTEQLSGTAFTVDRTCNQRTWLYRIQPSVVVGLASIEETTNNDYPKWFGHTDRDKDLLLDPNPLRWKAPRKQTECDFVSGSRLVAAQGSPETKNGIAIYMYAFDRDMTNRHFYNADGDLLIVPQQGSLRNVAA